MKENFSTLEKDQKLKNNLLVQLTYHSIICWWLFVILVGDPTDVAS